MVQRNVEVKRFHHHHDHHRHLVPHLVECYREVFSDPPWNEWLKCANPNCPHPRKYWGRRDAEELARNHYRHCDQPMVDFWPRHTVADELAHEVNAKASCWIATDDSKVVGFCWGYATDPQSLESKLGLKCAAEVKTGFPLENGYSLAYQSELGLLKEYREQGFAKLMVRRRLEDFRSMGIKVGVVRTRETPEPSVTFSWFTKRLGYQIVAKYPGDDGRVILARPFDDELVKLLS